MGRSLRRSQLDADPMEHNHISLTCPACQRAKREIERLRHICKTISTGLRGEYASREDMSKLADSAEVE